MRAKYCYLRYSQKTGNVDTCMTGMSAAIFKFTALSNTPKSKETIIVDLDTEEIIYTVTGSANGGRPLVDHVKRSAAACGLTTDIMEDLRRR